MSARSGGAPLWLWGLLAVAVAGTAAAFLVPHNEGRIRVNSPLDPNLGVAEPKLISSLNLRKQEDHPVTPDMEKAAGSLKAQKAPAFTLADTKGEVHTLASLTDKKPLLIFFVEKECPCCLGAKFFVDKMIDMYGSSLNAVGIINAEGEEAQKWVKTTKPRFLVLQDPQQKAIQAYKAERGVYTTLVAPGGSIDAAYPGYSLSSLDDMSRRIARLAGVPYIKFVSAAAPKTLTSGCPFPKRPSEGSAASSSEAKTTE